jgi:hypothetical protein
MNFTLQNFTTGADAPFATPEQFEYFSQLCANAHISAYNMDMVVAIGVVIICEIGEMVLRAKGKTLSDYHYNVAYESMKYLKIAAWVGVMIRLWVGA